MKCSTGDNAIAKLIGQWDGKGALDNAQEEFS